MTGSESVIIYNILSAVSSDKKKPLAPESDKHIPILSGIHTTFSQRANPLVEGGGSHHDLSSEFIITHALVHSSVVMYLSRQ